MIGADQGTSPGFGATADISRGGRARMDNVVSDTRTGVAALAPTADTPAGKQQLVNHLQGQLDRAKVLLQASERRNVALAMMIRNAASGYRGGAPMMPALGAGSPMMTPAAISGAPGIPNLAGLTTLTHRTNALTHSTAAFGATHNRQVTGGGPAAQEAVKAALSKLGCPYVWGAKGPNAFDCSGLTRWAYAQTGVTLGPDTYTQIKDGARVAPGDVQAGDLIFPKDSFGQGGPGHVQLAISPTEVVHAPTTGDVVKIAPMPSAFVAVRPTAT